MKLTEKYLKSIQKEIESAPTTRTSLSGRLFYSYIQYKRLYYARYRRNIKDALDNIIDEVTTTPTIDNSILRETLLINRLYQDSEIVKTLNVSLATLDQYLIGRDTRVYAGWLVCRCGSQLPLHQEKRPTCCTKIPKAVSLALEQSWIRSHQPVRSDYASEFHTPRARRSSRPPN